MALQPPVKNFQHGVATLFKVCDILRMEIASTPTSNGHEHISVDGAAAGQVWQGYSDWRAAPGGANQQIGTGSRMEAVEHCVATHLGDDIDDETIAAAQAALEAIA